MNMNIPWCEYIKFCVCPGYISEKMIFDKYHMKMASLRCGSPPGGKDGWHTAKVDMVDFWV